MKILCLRLNFKLLLSVNESHKHYESLIKLFIYLLAKFQNETACSVLSYYNIIVNLMRSYTGDNFSEKININSMQGCIKILKTHKDEIYVESKNDTSKTNFDNYLNNFDINLNADIDSLFSFVGQYTKDYIEYPDDEECLLESTDHLRSQPENSSQQYESVPDHKQEAPKQISKQDSIIIDEEDEAKKTLQIKTPENVKPEEVKEEKDEVVSEEKIKNVNNMLDDFFADE